MLIKNIINPTIFSVLVVSFVSLELNIFVAIILASYIITTAKAAIAKFMKEKLSTEEAFASATKKVKTITSDGQTQTANVTKESIKINSQIIKNSAVEIY